MIKDIQIRRLLEVPVKGDFTIKCEDTEQFRNIQRFFLISGDKIKFKSIPDIGLEVEDRDLYLPHSPYFPLYVSGDTRTKFIIKYETLNELLKLREIFNIRANKFDMYLIKKRGYDPFNAGFFKRCADPIIYKVMK